MARKLEDSLFENENKISISGQSSTPSASSTARYFEKYNRRFSTVKSFEATVIFCSLTLYMTLGWGGVGGLGLVWGENLI